MCCLESARNVSTTKLHAFVGGKGRKGKKGGTEKKREEEKRRKEKKKRKEKQRPKPLFAISKKDGCMYIASLCGFIHAVRVSQRGRGGGRGQSGSVHFSCVRTERKEHSAASKQAPPSLHECAVLICCRSSQDHCSPSLMAARTTMIKCMGGRGWASGRSRCQKW